MGGGKQEGGGVGWWRAAKAPTLPLAPPGSSWLLLAPPGSPWLPLAPPGSQEQWGRDGGEARISAGGGGREGGREGEREGGREGERTRSLYLKGNPY